MKPENPEGSKVQKFESSKEEYTKKESSESSQVESSREEYMEMGIPEEWVEPLKALGYTTVEKLKEVEKPGKLANDLNGYKKKKKLDLPGLSPKAVAGWL